VIEALVALVLAVFFVLVFHFAWCQPLIAIGGVGFCLYVGILLGEWALAKVRRP
jgi:hypothetical protein